MKDAILYLTCLVALACLLEPRWRFKNAMMGLAFTYVVIGSKYAQHAIDSCLREHPHHCELAVAMLILLHVAATWVLGRYGDDLEAVIVRHADRMAGR